MNVNLKNKLMPNTYVKLLIQDFDDLTRLSLGTGISCDQLSASNQTIKIWQHLKFVSNALAIRPSPDWHLYWGKRMAENFHGPITLAWLSAPTLGDGLDAFLKFIPLRVPYHTFSGKTKDTEFHCEVKERIDLGDTRFALIEVPLLVMHEYVRMFKPGLLNHARVELSYPKPAHAAYFNKWFACPVVFGCPQNALVILSKVRLTENVDYDKNTWESAKRIILQTTKTVSHLGDVTKILQEILSAHLEANPDMPIPTVPQIARQLTMSSRTLIRRLRKFDTTYRQILDDILKQKAHTLLLNSDCYLYQITESLGYKNPRSFRRAFNRWYGTTPRHYRQQFSRQDSSRNQGSAGLVPSIGLEQIT